MSDVPLVPPPSLRLSRTLTLDLLTSYAATLARAGSMLAIVSLLGHRTTSGYLAAFLFLRTILGFLNNLFVGVTPAAIAALGVRQREIVVTAIPIASVAAAPAVALDYQSRDAQRQAVPSSDWISLLSASVLPAGVAMIGVAWCMPLLTAAAGPLLPPASAHLIRSFSISFALGLLTRLCSDAAGGAIQARRLLWLDNALVALAELSWVAICFVQIHNPATTFESVADAYCFSGIALLVARWLLAGLLLDRSARSIARVDGPTVRRFLSVAGVLAFASLGDFLYAPANYLIIRKFLDPLLIADYGPALQIDSMLLLAVAALSSVILPRAVALYDAGDFAALRRAYVWATGVGVLLLAGGAGLTLTFSGPLLEAWLGNVPPGTRAILPFVLMHTVIGGTAGIGRAVLIGMGRLRAYTIATLGAGLLNVGLALMLAVGAGLGIRGIVFATIVTVTLRNALWMPWYILTRLRDARPRSPAR